MFENKKPFTDTQTSDHRTSSDGGSHGEAAQATSRKLREMEWGELTARLNATRDLRHALFEDRKGGGVDATDFALAASRYLGARDAGEAGQMAHQTRSESSDRQRSVNPVGLEPRKASPPRILGRRGQRPHEPRILGRGAKGEARDDR